MAVKYELCHCPVSLLDKENSKKYYPRTLDLETAGVKEIANRISDISTFSEADVMAMVQALGDMMGKLLKEGKRVYLPGIGYFHLTIEGKQRIIDPESKKIQLNVKDVNYRVDKVLKDSLSGIQFQRVIAGKQGVAFDSKNLDKLLTDFFIENKQLTRHDLEKLGGITSTTAWRILRQLVKEGKLVNFGSGHKSLYEPAKGCFGIDK